MNVLKIDTFIKALTCLCAIKIIWTVMSTLSKLLWRTGGMKRMWKGWNILSLQDTNILIVSKRWRCKRWYSISYPLPWAISWEFFICGIIWTVFIGCKTEWKQKHVVAYACLPANYEAWQYVLQCILVTITSTLQKEHFWLLETPHFSEVLCRQPLKLQPASSSGKAGTWTLSIPTDAECSTSQCHSKVNFDHTALLRSY